MHCVPWIEYVTQNEEVSVVHRMQPMLPPSPWWQLPQSLPQEILGKENEETQGGTCKWKMMLWPSDNVPHIALRKVSCCLWVRIPGPQPSASPGVCWAVLAALGFVGFCAPLWSEAWPSQSWGSSRQAAPSFLPGRASSDCLPACKAKKGQRGCAYMVLGGSHGN